MIGSDVMKILLKRENLKNTILTLAYMLLGILFLVLPLKMFNFVEAALCVALLIAGVIFIMCYSLMSVEDRLFKNLIYGIILVALGICMMLVSRFFGIILSLIIGYSGVGLIISAVKTKKKGDKTWITELVIGIVVAAMSIVVMILSGRNAAKKIISIFFGIIFLINGIYLLIQMIVLVLKSKEKKEKVLVSSDSVESLAVAEDKVESKEELAQANETVEEVKPQEKVEQKKETIKKKKKK